MAEKVIDKYLDAVKAASDVLSKHGCEVSGLSIESSRVLDGVITGDASIALNIYVPVPDKADA